MRVAHLLFVTLAVAGCRLQGDEPSGAPPTPQAVTPSTPPTAEEPVAGVPVGSAQLTSAAITKPAGASALLKGERIALLATDGVEEAELAQPRRAFEDQGATVVVLAPHGGEIQAYNHTDKGALIGVDATVASADPRSFDALFLPGGVRNGDTLRVDPAAVQFAKAFAATGRPIAAICHGPWTLIEAKVVRGKTMTSWPSLKTDLQNAGARWEDEPVVDDHGLVTSRKPDDIPAFDAAAIEEFASRHAERGGLK